jgi:tetratricopeptide (TPR) repeat protein
LLSHLKEKHARIKGQKFLASKNPGKAHRFLIKALRLNESAENMFNLALCNMALSKYNDAEVYLRKIQINHAENELNILALLESLLMQRKWSELENTVNDLKKSFSGNVTFMRYSALITDPVEREKYVSAKEDIHEGFQELDKGNKTTALQKFLRAADHLKENPELLQNIGLIYLEESEYNEAYKYFEKALAISPANFQLQKLLIRTKKKLPA